MKLIDGHALIARVEDLYKRGAVDLNYFHIVREAVQMEPEITPPVIRCENCRHYDSGENEVDAWMQCRLRRMSVYPDFYCADGEAKNDAVN